MKREEQTTRIEILRIVSALGVVVLHVSAGYLRNSSTVGTYTFVSANIYHSLMRFAVGCFVMISGLLFLDPNRDETIKKILSRHVKKLAIIYVFWQMLFSMLERGGGIAGITIKCRYHLWFLPMLIGLYLITPVLRKIAQDKKLVEYLILLCLLFCYIPNLFQIISGAYSRYKGLRNLLMVTDYTAGYLCYYLMGFYFCFFGVSEKLKKIVYSLGICGAIYGIIVTELYARQILKYSGIPTQNESLNTFLFSAAVFLFFVDQVGKNRWKRQTQDCIKCISSYTLTIYLIHPVFVEMLKGIRLYNDLSGYAWIMIPIFSVVCFMISFGAAIVLRRIPIIKMLC